ncbi:hypothetical protein D046_6675A, partial [Vibrio parahaemolyticus V-223/04]
MWSQ